MAALLSAACGSHPAPTSKKETPKPVEYFHVDPATAGDVSGRIVFHGTKPKGRKISMDSDPGCPVAGTTFEPVITGKDGGLGNAFVYIESGFSGKHFEPPQQPVVLDQHGCMYSPHVVGVMVGQMFDIQNSDKVSHNIHPMPHNNREWSAQQSPGVPDIQHKFAHPDIMIPVKCNVHSWMHAYIGVVDNPYYAVTKPDGTFDFKNVPPGDYTVGVWHETLGEQKQTVHVDPSGKATVDFTYPAKS